MCSIFNIRFNQHRLLCDEGFACILSTVPLPPQVDLGILNGTECALYTQDAAKKQCKGHDHTQ